MGKGKNEEKTVYMTSDRSISFLSNPSDGPGAYYVIINNRCDLYVHDRALPALTNPEIAPDMMVRNLERRCGENLVAYVLKKNQLSPERLQAALRQLRASQNGGPVELIPPR